MKSSGLNVPSADKGFCESVFIDNSLEIIGVSLREVILGLEGLTTLTLTARVITDLMKGNRRVNDQEMGRVTGTNEVEVVEEFGIVELFLKRQSGARETGDKDDGRFGRVTGSMSPDLSTVFGLHELAERGHTAGIRVLMS